MSNAFYDSIATYYDEIFPHFPNQTQFVRSFLAANAAILDIGCATGSLLADLSTGIQRGFGIDLDSRLLEIAERKIQGKPNLKLEQRDMRTLESAFSSDSFDAILCFGNTLPHLAGPSELQAVFESIYRLLKPNGYFLFQIIHFDRIFREELHHLPTINTELVCFERNYHYSDQKKIEFETSLTVKVSGKQILNCIPLTPFMKDALFGVLKECNCNEIEFFGDFAQNPLNKDSIPLICKVKK